MKRSTGNILFSMILAITVLSLPSCIKEDFSNCHATLALTFSYEHNPDFTDLFNQNVESLSLHFYDGNGNYLFTKETDTQSLEDKHTLRMQVDGGDYQIAVWGNYDKTEYESVVGPNIPFDDCSLNLHCDNQNCISGNTTDLFHGMAKIRVPRMASVFDTIPMIRNTNDIIMLFEGMEHSMGTDYNMQISGHNGSYHFDHSPILDIEKVTYLPTYSTDIQSNIHYGKAAFKVMRLWTGSDLVFEIRNDKGALLRSDNVVELLQQEFPQLQTDDDLDRYYHFEFVYRLNRDETISLVAIRVGDWEAVPGQSGGI